MSSFPSLEVGRLIIVCLVRQHVIDNHNVNLRKTT